MKEKLKEIILTLLENGISFSTINNERGVIISFQNYSGKNFYIVFIEESRRSEHQGALCFMVDKRLEAVLYLPRYFRDRFPDWESYILNTNSFTFGEDNKGKIFTHGDAEEILTQLDIKKVSDLLRKILNFQEEEQKI